MRIFSAMLVSALLALSDSFAAEEAKDLLKVPLPADRPVGENPQPVDGTEAGKSALSPAPSAEPREEQPKDDPPADEAPLLEESAGDVDQIVPEAFPLERYATLWEKSPFQTESVAPPVESPGLSQRFSLSGILRENGEYLVWVRERATQQSYMVSKTAPNVIGLSLVEVAESPEKQSEASATVRLGEEIGVIKFDAIAAPGAPPPMAAPQPFQQPGMRQFPQPPRPAVASPQAAAPQPGYPGSQQMPVPPGIPAVPAPGVVPPVPGPPIPAPGQVQVAPGQEQMPPPRVIRRRAIVPASP